MLKLVNVSWNSTNKCNLRCKHCYAESGESNKGELTLEEVKKNLVDELALLKTDFISISGGEPLLRDDIFEILEYIKSKGIKISMVTNGYYITDEVIDKLSNAGVIRMQVSLESASPEENDFIRGKGSFDKAVEAIKRLSKSNIYTAVAVTPFSKSVDLEELIDLSISLGADVVSIRRFVPMGRGIEFSRQYTSYSRKEFLSKVEYLREKYNGRIKVNSADPIQGILNNDIEMHELTHMLGGCTAGITSLAVDSIGNIKACTRMDHSLGNIRDTKISDVWKEHPDLLKLRCRTMLEGKCGACVYKNICGGCRAGAINSGNGLLGEDEECFLSISLR